MMLKLVTGDTSAAVNVNDKRLQALADICFESGGTLAVDAAKVVRNPTYFNAFWMEPASAVSIQKA